MKWSNALYVVVFVVFLTVLSTQASSNKKEVQTKHKPLKPHKSVLVHSDGSSSVKAKPEHHNVKEVEKHAPFTVTHHEAKTQTDLGHKKKKPLHGSESASDLKLQDLSVEDTVHHKLQNHKNHNGHDSHGQNSHHQNWHALSRTKLTNNHSNGGRLGTATKPEKPGLKPPKKMYMNKNKKIKRAKRLHKQYIF